MICSKMCIVQSNLAIPDRRLLEVGCWFWKECHGNGRPSHCQFGVIAMASGIGKKEIPVRLIAGTKGPANMKRVDDNARPYRNIVHVLWLLNAIFWMRHCPRASSCRQPVKRPSGLSFSSTEWCLRVVTACRRVAWSS